MSGMDWRTGKLISAKEQLIQSITVILTTPKFTRIVRRSFGSDVFYLVDRPETESVDFSKATAEALSDLEDFLLIRTILKRPARGVVELRIDGVYQPTKEPLSVGVKI